jgi:hypothetical protein
VLAYLREEMECRQEEDRITKDRFHVRQSRQMSVPSSFISDVPT